ncbi:MAG: peptide chain release factor 2 [Thermoanaerobaculia bacterium]
MDLELQQRLGSLGERLQSLRGHLEQGDPEARLATLDRAMQEPGFFEDPERSAPLLKERRQVERRLQSLRRLRQDAGDLAAWEELLAEGESDPELDAFLDRLEADVQRLDLELKLSGPDAEKNAIVALHPGAGGTESQDWAEMLLRMYLRWAERRGFAVEILDRLDGEEAGVKSVTFAVRGPHAYGYLDGETGVHRLVRISPFDSQSRRHTSFASVDVYPEVDDDIAIEIDDKDLRVDTFRSSGAGGQHVNVTDSAIRITHLPTGTVVTCQNERSQHKNRATAMHLLRARLYALEQEKQKVEQAQLAGEKKEIGWGSQIRSYVLQPYQLVKDLRTQYEVGDPSRILDGDLDGFIEAWLAAQAKKSAD